MIDNIRAFILFFLFHLPPVKDPAASQMIQEPMIRPIESSLPEKRMSSSLSRIVWAIMPPRPPTIKTVIKQISFRLNIIHIYPISLGGVNNKSYLNIIYRKVVQTAFKSML
jgi:hypothetical protein